MGDTDVHWEAALGHRGSSVTWRALVSPTVPKYWAEEGHWGEAEGPGLVFWAQMLVLGSDITGVGSIPDFRDGPQSSNHRIVWIEGTFQVPPVPPLP